MYYAVSYYPEHYETDRLRKDIPLMKELGINAIRTGEFAWFLFEPKEGEYNFSWLDNVIEKLGKEGIMTIIGTPTASPPKWLIDKHPDICQTTLDGKNRGYGMRRNACVNSKNFRKYSINITRKIAEHYKDNDYVFAYQIDNEFMAGDPYCYCPECKKKFQEVMKKRYGKIENLNEEWGMDFWSLSFPSWDSVELHAPGQPSLLKNFYEFTSDSYIEFCNDMANTIMEIDSEKIITTNLCSSGYLYRMDLKKLYSKLDITSLDLYPMYRMWREYEMSLPEEFDLTETSFALALTRSYKNEHFWITEKETPRLDNPKEYNLVTLMELAHGARMFSAFEWRKKHIGFEQGHPALLSYDGVPRGNFKVFKEALNLVDTCKEVKGSMPKAEVAIVRDFQADFSFMAKCRDTDFKYLICLYEFYRAVVSNNLNCDIIMPDEDFSKYKVVIAPAWVNIDEALSKKIDNFVKTGGKYITTIYSAVRNQENRVLREVQPCFINNLTGVEIEDTIKSSKSINISGNTGKTYDGAKAFDLLKASDAEVLFWFEHENIEKTPAITRKKFGNGEAYYFACIPQKETLKILFKDILSFIPNEIECESGNVEIIKTTDTKNEWYFVVNKGKENVSIKINNDMLNVLSGEKLSEKAQIDAMGYLLLKK